MRVRVVRCEDESHDLPWVLADECPHWSMDCPRSKKKKKAHHKLKRTDPGYDIVVTAPDHPYEPDPDGWDDRDVAGFSWHDLPSEMRYGSCTCGLPWGFHMPWNQGDRRYVGKYKASATGQPYLVPAQASLLVTCTTGCGFVGAVKS